MKQQNDRRNMALSNDNPKTGTEHPVKRATIKDVAKLAMVSTATVSRVLSNGEKVKAVNREKVHTAIKALNYTPNMAAQQIHGVFSITIGVITTRSSDTAFGNPYFSSIIGAIGTVVEKRNCYLQIHSYGSMNDETEKTLHLYRSGRVQGFILLSSRVHDPLIMAMVNNHIPFVLVGRTMNLAQSESQVFSVNTDNISDSQQAVEFLIKKGHRIIGMLCGPDQYVVSQDRLTGYQNALSLNRLEFRESLKIDAGYSYEDAKNATETLIRNNPGMTAIFASDDLKGVAAIKKLQEMNIEVPEQVGVIGFDNFEIGRFIQPSLTTIDVPIAKLGKIATGMLIDRIQSKQVGQNCVILETQLLPREST